MHQVNISRSEEKISSLNPFSLGALPLRVFQHRTTRDALILVVMKATGALRNTNRAIH